MVACYSLVSKVLRKVTAWHLWRAMDRQWIIESQCHLYSRSVLLVQVKFCVRSHSQSICQLLMTVYFGKMADSIELPFGLVGRCAE